MHEKRGGIYFSDQIKTGPSGLGDGEQVEVRELQVFWFTGSSGWKRKSHSG